MAATADPNLNRVAKDFIRLRALLDEPETPIQDFQRLQAIVKVAERDHDWTVHAAMALHNCGPNDGAISYNVVSILRTIERRARRARLYMMKYDAGLDLFQTDYWRTVICQDIDDENGDELPHWDSDVEEELGKVRCRNSTFEKLGTSSARLQRWIREADEKTGESKR